MNLRFWINTTEIEEPSGFDTFKSVIERTENHGVSAEVSFSTLEFYGVAFNIIQSAYYNDIDSELTFRVEMKCADNDTFSDIYIGVIDLSSYDENTSDYCSIKCKVGEIGVRTTFNNRADTKVYLNSLISMDKVDLPVNTNLDRQITIPGKSIVCMNYGLITPIAVSLGKLSTGTSPYGGITYFIILGYDNQEISELGELNYSHLTATSLDFNQTPNTFYNNKYDVNQVNISYNVNCQVALTNPNFYWTLSVALHKIEDGVKSNLRLITSEKTMSAVKSISDTYSETFTCTKDAKFVLRLVIYTYDTSGANYTSQDITLTALEGNFFKISALTNLEDSLSKVSLIYDCFTRLSEIISGISVKSDWYGMNEYGGNIGGGALKCITSGLKLRNAKLTNGGEPYLFLSFKELFEAMKAVDCIGWGYSVENDIECIRVEPISWFYKDELIMELNDIQEISRKFNPDKTITRLKIGYSKYSEIGKINSIDTYHTEREYSRRIKAIDVQEEQLCKFITDPFAIEYTRRLSLEKTTEDWTYDNDIFLIALRFKRFLNGDFWMRLLSVDIGVENSENSLLSPETMINSRISPARNARRWLKRLFEVNSENDKYELASGTGNIDAICQPKTENGWTYCEDSNGILSEKEDVDYEAPILKSEIMSFDYPLRISEYQVIKNNPYGYFLVNGIKCYLKKIEYSYIEGLASFELKIAAQ